MKNKLLEKLSWVPYNLISKLKSRKRNPLLLDFRKLGIPKSFKFYFLEKDLGLSNQLNSFGFREPINLKYSYDFIKKEDIVLDIGSNLGLFPLLAYNAKRIIAVEPIKECIPLLKKNLKENKIWKKIRVIKMAVGKEGKLRIKKEDKINLSRIVEKKTKGAVEIKSKPLIYFIKKYKANVLRIDVEGYEYEILYKKIPKKINKIAMEFHTALLGKKRVPEIMNYFEKEGFEVKYFIEDLPIRLYPFYSILKLSKLINLFTYIKRDLKPRDCYPLLKKGRTVKYLFLVRRKDFKK